MATIYEGRPRKYTAQISLPDGRRTSRTFTSKVEATRWARQAEVQADAGARLPAADLRIEDLIAAYVTHLAETGASRSKLSALGIIREHLGRQKLRDVTTRTFMTYVAERAAGGTGPATLLQDLSYINTLLTRGGALEGVDTGAAVMALKSARSLLNATGAVSRPIERSRRPTEAELITLKQYWAGRRKITPMWGLTLFAVSTAMRLSEITRLRWVDLDAEKRTIMIKDRKHPRSKKGNDQVVPLLRGPVVVAGTIIDPLTIIQDQRQQGPLIFPHDARTVSSMFTRAINACGIEDLHFHDLRHDGVSRLFEAGYSIEQVSLVSGHRDWNMLRRYTNLKAESLHRE